MIHQELLNQGLSVSLSSVKRTLERQGLIRKGSPWKRWHFTLPRPQVVRPGDLIQIQGSEFFSWFIEKVRVLGLAHRHSRVRKPGDNGHIERFIRTLQEECLSKIPQKLRAYQKEIPEYLHYYNNERLHLALNLKTPIQCVQAIG